MAKKRDVTAEEMNAALTGPQSEATAAEGTDGNGQQANPATADGNGKNTEETGKRSGPRVRTDSEYWLVATDPMDGTSEFLINAPTVGQGRKLRVRMLGTPMARGRKIRLARVTYVEG